MLAGSRKCGGICGADARGDTSAKSAPCKRVAGVFPGGEAAVSLTDGSSLSLTFPMPSAQYIYNARTKSHKGVRSESAVLFIGFVILPSGYRGSPIQGLSTLTSFFTFFIGIQAAGRNTGSEGEFAVRTLGATPAQTQRLVNGWQVCSQVAPLPSVSSMRSHGPHLGSKVYE